MSFEVTEGYTETKTMETLYIWYLKKENLYEPLELVCECPLLIAQSLSFLW